MTVRAPFNFARIPRAVWYPQWGHLVTQDVPLADGHSGTIEIEIKAATQLLVGGERRQSAAHSPGEVWPVRVDDGRYAIPPSTLQGLIRSRLEIACFGKLGPFVDKKRFGIRDLTPAAKPYFQDKMLDATRFPDIYPRVRAGWLRRIGRDYELRPCKLARIQFENLPARRGAPWDRRGPPLAERYSWLTSFEGEWDIEAADPAPPHTHQHGHLQIHYHEAYPVGQAPREPAVHRKSGSIVVSGIGAPGKHMEFVFYDDGAPVTLANDFADRFDEFESIHAPDDGRPPNGSWKFYRDEGYAGDAFSEGGWMPIFWLGDLDNDGQPSITSFGLAFMFKLAHEHDTHRMLFHSTKEHVSRYDGDEASDTGRLDLASLIFGAAGGEKGDFFRRSLKRRAAFGWAYETSGKTDNDLVSTEAGASAVLLGPKPSYFPIYVRQTPRGDAQLPANGQMPVYPYATYTSVEARTAATTPPLDSHARPELSGAKVWPVGPDGSSYLNRLPEPPSSKVANRLNALPAGSCFVVKLTVHNLRTCELGALLWALTLGDEAALDGQWGTLRHRIGMGKALNLGSVKLRVTSGISALVPNAPGKASDPITASALLASFRARMAQVYPTLGEQQSAHEWEQCVQVRALVEAATPRVERTQPLTPHMALPEYMDGRREFCFLKPMIGQPAWNNELRRSQPAEPPAEAGPLEPFAPGDKVVVIVSSRPATVIAIDPAKDKSVRIKDKGSGQNQNCYPHEIRRA